VTWCFLGFLTGEGSVSLAVCVLVASGDPVAGATGGCVVWVCVGGAVGVAGVPGFFATSCDGGLGRIGVGDVISACWASGIGTASASAVAAVRAWLVQRPYPTNPPTTKAKMMAGTALIDIESPLEDMH